MDDTRRSVIRLSSRNRLPGGNIPPPSPYNLLVPPIAQPGHTENLTVALTGASGIVFGQMLLRVLDADPRVARIHFVPSENSLRVLAEELSISGRAKLAEKLLGQPSAKIVQHSENDVGAAIASGSYPSSGMIVLPCSMGTLAGIANGLAGNLIERAADVCLKERRPLILCLRETPFNKIHIRNMGLAADAGATVFPIIPAFYNQPGDSTEMARQFVFRVLAHIGLPQPGAYVWKPDQLSS
jgi:4-hydroxy-3-polyprenylbenzoate decarboxylase